MRPERYLLEVCAASVSDALAAQQAGADRIELNQALELGGLTPSPGLLAEVQAVCALPMICMVRPRPGGFVYSQSEWRVMLRDAEQFLECSVGIACGCLTGDGRIDRARLGELMRLANGREVVFHRAFDCLTDLQQGLRVLIDHGVTRVLTSGGCPTAIEGLAVLSALHRQTTGKIELVAGSGVRADNAARILTATGCGQIHGTFRCSRRDIAGNPLFGDWAELDPALVRAVRLEMDILAAGRESSGSE